LNYFFKKTFTEENRTITILPSTFEGLEIIGKRADKLLLELLKTKEEIEVDKTTETKRNNIDNLIEIIVSAKHLYNYDFFEDIKKIGDKNYYKELEEKKKKLDEVLELDKIKDLDLKERLRKCLKYITTNWFFFFLSFFKF